MGRAIIGKNSITCIRGPLSKVMIVVKDRQGNEWYSKFTQEDFEKLNDNYHVDVIDTKNRRNTKKFIKSSLTFVKLFEIEIPKAE